MSRGRTFPFTVNSNSTCKRLQQAGSWLGGSLPRASVGLMSGVKEVQMPVHGAFAAPACPLEASTLYAVASTWFCLPSAAGTSLHPAHFTHAAIVERNQGRSGLRPQVLGVGWIFHLKYKRRLLRDGRSRNSGNRQLCRNQTLSDFLAALVLSGMARQSASRYQI